MNTPSERVHTRRIRQKGNNMPIKKTLETGPGKEGKVKMNTSKGKGVYGNGRRVVVGVALELGRRGGK